MIKIFEYEGNKIQFDLVDGNVMANATLMFKANNVRLDHWKVAPNTIRYIDACTRRMGISENQIVITKLGSSENGGGTWIHEKLILQAARYISVDFEIWCDDVISKYLYEKNNSTPKIILPDFNNPVLAARAWADEVEAKNNALQLAKDTQERVLELQPKAELAETFLISNDSISLGDFSKVIGWGRNNLFKQMKEDKYLMKNNSPYQKYIDQNYFILIEVPVLIGGKVEIKFQPRLNVSGQRYFQKRYGK